MSHALLRMGSYEFVLIYLISSVDNFKFKKEWRTLTSEIMRKIPNLSKYIQHSPSSYYRASRTATWPAPCQCSLAATVEEAIAKIGKVSCSNWVVCADDGAYELVLKVEKFVCWCQAPRNPLVASLFCRSLVFNNNPLDVLQIGFYFILTTFLVENWENGVF